MKQISLFFKLNFLLTTILYIAFLSFNSYQSIGSLIFSIVASISTSATLYLIFYLLFRAFFRFEKILLPFLSLLFFLIDLILISDFIIFKVWKFHINAMVLNIITSPAAMDSLGIKSSAYYIIAGLILAIVISIYLIYRYSVRLDRSDLNKKFNRLFVPLLLLIIIIEKFTFGVADIYNKMPYLEVVKPIPLYQPLTFSKFASRYLGINVAKKREQKNQISTTSQINYPLAPIKIDKSAKRPNIFIFFFDAARETNIKADTTPNIINFSKDSLRFTNHISGGDATRFGIFSFFYGLNATYWFNFLYANREPIFFEVLKKRGYEIKIISSTNTKWPEFRKTVYIGIKNKIEDQFKGTPSQKDAKSTKAFIDFIEGVDKTKPIFSFVFLDAPHGYSYPNEYEKFKPNVGNSGLDYLRVDKERAREFLNSYKNALFYDDKLFGDMIEALKSKDLYKDSIIIFSSDHGQEFFEYGFFGHNSSFSKAQINSPLIMKIPDLTPATITKTTSHLDVIPTLLTILGVKNSPSDYSNGYDLFSKDYNKEYCYIAKWNKNAIRTDSYTHIFSNLPNEIFKNETRDNKSYKRVKNRVDDGIERILPKVLRENRQFLK